MAFTALVTDKDDSGKITNRVVQLDESELPEGNVLVGIEWAGFNYKDGMALSGVGGLVRAYPHVGGVDFSGRVIESRDPRYHPGQAVILTGWRVGEWHWGGFSTRARVNADWLVPLPRKLSTRDAMVLGTAGFTAMLAVNRLKNEGLKPGSGAVLVTGAGGGVGSIATLLLSRSGYQVDAMTGRAELEGDLRALGATNVIGREALAANPKKLLATRWPAAIDNIGGAPLGELLKQIHQGGCVAAVGLAAGDGWEASVIPFILRGVTLAGIDSVMQPFEARMAVWERLASLFSASAYGRMVTEAKLEELPEIGKVILEGGIKGRVICKPGG